MGVIMQNSFHLKSTLKVAKRGFTLIELLVVLTIIGLVMAGLGIALRDSGGSTGLASGQRVVASMLTATRGQAILHQTNARLLIALNDAGPNSEGRTLRYLVIVRQNESGQWVPTSEGVFLPRNVFMVPEPNGTNNGLFVNWNGDARHSNGQSVTKNVEGIPSVSDWIVFEYNSSGVLSNAPPDREIILAAGRQQSADQIVLESQTNVRGIVLRRVGTYSLFSTAL